jgi:hypothetical protein
MADLKLPDVSEPLTDPATGRMSHNWYRFFALLVARLNQLTP